MKGSLVMSDWKKIGVIGVDAGICWIGDPCYILHKEDREKEELEKVIGSNWVEFCRKIDHDNYPTQQQFNYPVGHPGLGVLVSTGYGDGCYDVMVKKNEEGRITEVKVVFVDEEILPA